MLALDAVPLGLGGPWRDAKRLQPNRDCSRILAAYRRRQIVRLSTHPAAILLGEEPEPALSAQMDDLSGQADDEDDEEASQRAEE